ncbi:AAA family ATPase [Pseudogemmatithrix spongiicola]|uniref:AAA family ATPase n=1 Tax=Pseudogemmatithrix spongiicola TaxID=3062599 RepID=A0AA49K0J8_9BACT|nr:AAA family ATPase [Gemmatimonadaceae bacterium 'strain 138']WKW15547.1 AAA family ATPase [Gemmatimonadaceae bacterium 'strain 318']
MADKQPKKSAKKKPSKTEKDDTRGPDASGDPAAVPRPRLSRLTVQNFRAIGAQPVSIELDNIVVLVGPNNTGKSSILKAYQLVMNDGSGEVSLSADDFPNGIPDPNNPPTIELTTIVYGDLPGKEWIHTTADGEMVVRERWQWKQVGKPERVGFNVHRGRWAEPSDDEKGPWGVASVANSRRPEPHHIDAFASPDKQATAISKLLSEVLTQRMAEHKSKGSDPESAFGKLLKSVSELQETVLAEVQSEVVKLEDSLSESLNELFPKHRVKFDTNTGKDLSEYVSLFKSAPSIRMGPTGGFQSPLEQQGSGARRTLLWTAIKLVAEANRAKKGRNQRPFVLLLDEPEICLHPGAVREASRLLYELPEKASNWQVMLTTHSPCFIDFSRDHTSVVRVERAETGAVTGTTIFRPKLAKFDATDKEALKLLNLCDPYVAEFFFGGRVVLVEGDTEYAAFRFVIAQNPDTFRNIHIVKARGKATIVALSKILNQFGAPYAILHDSDMPTVTTKTGTRRNSAWTDNLSILAEIQKAPAETRLLASIENFEVGFLGIPSGRSEKPYNALEHLRSDADALAAVTELLWALVDFQRSVPAGAVEWSAENDLLDAIKNRT